MGFDFKKILNLERRLPEFRQKIRMVRSISIPGSSYEMSRHSNVRTSSVERDIISAEKYEHQYQMIKDELHRLKSQLMPLIHMLEDGQHRQVLEMRYIKGFSVTKISIEMNYSQGNIYRLLRDAEKSIDSLSIEKHSDNGLDLASRQQIMELRFFYVYDPEKIALLMRMEPEAVSSYLAADEERLRGKISEFICEQVRTDMAT